MAKLKIIQEKRCGKDGKSSIKISVSVKGETAYIPVGVSVLPECWDPKEAKVISINNCDAINRMIRKKYIQIELAFISLESFTGFDGMDAKRLRDVLCGLNDNDDKSECLFRECFVKFMESYQNDGIRGVYKCTLRRMGAFDPFLSRRTFDDINKK